MSSIIITGCGRSGTKFIAKLLQKLGKNVAHEGIGNAGIVSTYVLPKDVTVSSPYGPNFAQLPYNSYTILHQIRNPLDTISSLQTTSDDSWNFFKNYIDINSDDSIILKGMKYWYYWNKKAESVSEWSYRIENLKNVFQKFCNYCNTIADYDILENMRKDVNTREHTQLSWKDLNSRDKNLTNKIKILAKEYGYNEWK